jgi:hypothetical protein
LILEHLAKAAVETLRELLAEINGVRINGVSVIDFHHP